MTIALSNIMTALIDNLVKQRLTSPGNILTENTRIFPLMGASGALKNIVNCHFQRNREIAPLSTNQRPNQDDKRDKQTEILTILKHRKTFSKETVLVTISVGPPPP